MQLSGITANAYTRSPLFHPTVHLSYEQMFPSSKTSTLARHTLGALRLTRSFLLLEDDYDVDWEVDWNEPIGETHSHRAPLRGRSVSRRPDQPAPRNHVCLSPVNNLGSSRASARLVSSAVERSSRKKTTRV
jgi:hypothetical protein